MRPRLVLKLAAILLIPITGLSLVGFWNLDIFSSSENLNPVEALTLFQNPNNSPVAVSVSTTTAAVSVISNTTTSAQSQASKVNSVTVSSTDNPVHIVVNDTPATSAVCPANPLDHVYTPSRLQVIEACKTVTGNIESVRPELDGDFHIGLHPDPQFANAVNDCNRTCLFGLEKGRLVVEVVCVFHPIFPKAARDTCEGFRSNVSFPLTHVHVRVTGTWVKDLDHGWLEIHPAWEIKEIT